MGITSENKSLFQIQLTDINGNPITGTSTINIKIKNLDKGDVVLYHNGDGIQVPDSATTLTHHSDGVWSGMMCACEYEVYIDGALQEELSNSFHPSGRILDHIQETDIHRTLSNIQNNIETDIGVESWITPNNIDANPDEDNLSVFLSKIDNAFDNYLKTANFDDVSNLVKFADSTITSASTLDPNKGYEIETSNGSLTGTVNNDMNEGDIIRFILTTDDTDNFNTVTIDKQTNLPPFYYSQDSQPTMTFASDCENAIVTIYHTGTYLVVNMSSSGEFFSLGSNDASDINLSTAVTSAGYPIDDNTTEVESALDELNKSVGQTNIMDSIDRLDSDDSLTQNIIEVLKYAKEKIVSTPGDDGAGRIHIYSDSATGSSLPEYSETSGSFVTKKIISLSTHGMERLTARFKMKNESVSSPSYVNILIQGGDSQAKTLQPVGTYQEVSMSLNISTLEGLQTFEFQLHGNSVDATKAKSLNLYLE